MGHLCFMPIFDEFVGFRVLKALSLDSCLRFAKRLLSGGSDGSRGFRGSGGSLWFGGSCECDWLGRSGGPSGNLSLMCLFGMVSLVGLVGLMGLLGLVVLVDLLGL